MSRFDLAAETSLLAPRSEPQAARYGWGGCLYTSLGDAVAEPVGGCANFTTGMYARGVFTLDSALRPDLHWANVAPLLASFSFNDGLVVYGSDDPQVRVALFTVCTDEQGAITHFSARLQRYRDAAAPHRPGERLDQLYILDGLMTVGVHNAVCATVGPGPDGAPDTCESAAADTATSYGQAPPAEPPVARPLPAVSRTQSRRLRRTGQRAH